MAEQHAHRWRLGPPTRSDWVEGVCAGCGAVRQFRAWEEEGDWARLHRERPGLALKANAARWRRRR